MADDDEPMEALRGEAGDANFCESPCIRLLSILPEPFISVAWFMEQCSNALNKLKDKYEQYEMGKRLVGWSYFAVSGASNMTGPMQMPTLTNDPLLDGTLKILKQIAEGEGVLVHLGVYTERYTTATGPATISVHSSAVGPSRRNPPTEAYGRRLS